MEVVHFASRSPATRTASSTVGGGPMQSENGMLVVGPERGSGGAIDYAVNSGKSPVTTMRGARHFDSAKSFGMTRSRHVRVALIGSLQADRAGKLSHSSVPGTPVFRVGRAMDLTPDSDRPVITMVHRDKRHSSKMVSLGATACLGRPRGSSTC